MRKGIVDRITVEGAVCEWEDRSTEVIPFTAFSENPQEGDVIQIQEGRVQIRKEETKERRRKMKCLFERLKK